MNPAALLKIISPPPKDDADAIQAWTEQRSLLSLLQHQHAADSVILYGSSFNSGSLLLHSILVSLEELDAMDPGEMARWDTDSARSWGCGLVWGGGRPPRVEFSAPSIRIGDVELQSAHQLVFHRSFEARHEDKRYFEIAQFLVHAHDLHWMPERQAWCRLDDQGDVEDVIRVVEIEGREGYGNSSCVLIDRQTMEMHLSATGTAVVQLFDSTCIPKSFHGWRLYDTTDVVDPAAGLYYRFHLEGHNGSWFRGIQVLRPQRTSEEFGAYLKEQDDQPKHYESFITHDWKNKRIATVNCSPKTTASYFDKDSPLPFHTSPVFFRPEVLDKYKADPDKYTLEHRSISCRNSWYLQTYDVNDAGQVHTYIKYLSDLPYSEQVYWKSFNEAPKGGISKRAYETDFEGTWYTDADSLIDLESLLRKLHENNSGWFLLREPDLLKQLHYPLTASAKAWSDTLIVLAKIVVEGLQKKFFEDMAKQQGSAGDAKWASIRWAQEALQTCGIDESQVVEVIEPFRTLQLLRTKLSAHAAGNEASRLRADLLRKHRTPRGHVQHICTELSRSLTFLRDIYK